MSRNDASRFSPPVNRRLKRFFLWLTRRTFQDLQIQDREVAEYISDMLSQFARADRLYRIRNAQGVPLESVVEMFLEAEMGRSGLQEERDLFQQIGDYVLFMTGIFRDHVESMGFLTYYMQEGPRAYRRVWELDQGLFRPTARLFERLSRSFEFNAGALHYMRKTFFRDPGGGDPFGSWHRQVLLNDR